MTTAQMVGIREAKAHLSKYLRSVRQGNEIILTDRNRPVGKIVPIPDGELSLADRLRRLEDTGMIEPKQAGYRRTPSPLPLPQGLAQALLQKDRDNG